MERSGDADLRALRGSLKLACRVLDGDFPKVTEKARQQALDTFNRAVIFLTEEPTCHYSPTLWDEVADLARVPGCEV